MTNGQQRTGNLQSSNLPISNPPDLLAFDADDTLWHNESLYAAAQAEFARILAPYVAPDGVEQALYQTEMRNLPHFGYGIKSFTLSMVETAVALTGGRITGPDILRIVNLGKKMIAAEVELLPGVEETLAQLHGRVRMVVITKGDLLDQERKLARSGLGRYFERLEVVSDKNEAVYARLLAELGVAPARFMMVGNSLRSDVLPVVAVGGRAVHIPYHITWAHEEVEEAGAGEGAPYYRLEHIGQLPALLSGAGREE